MLPIFHRLTWVLLSGWLFQIALAQDRPNILWISAEDLSPNLGCYGDAAARTPHLDSFARGAVRYTRAFATAPVCSPARSCLISGVYATTLGTQRPRSQFPVPRSVRGFPAYLREAGYYCVNNVKTDYNLGNEAAFIQDAWDESSWSAVPTVYPIVPDHENRRSRNAGGFCRQEIPAGRPRRRRLPSGLRPHLSEMPREP